MAHAKLAALAVLAAVLLLHASASAVAIDQMSATMTLYGFGSGQGEPSECDGQYHDGNEMLAGLSTRWYLGGRRCQRMISIRSTQNERTVRARVVDECDSRHGGCKDNTVDTSIAVWKALGLDTNLGEVPVTWSDS